MEKQKAWRNKGVELRDFRAKQNAPQNKTRNPGEPPYHFWVKTASGSRIKLLQHHMEERGIYFYSTFTPLLLSNVYTRSEIKKRIRIGGRLQFKEPTLVEYTFTSELGIFQTDLIFQDIQKPACCLDKTDMLENQFLSF